MRRCHRNKWACKLVPFLVFFAIVTPHWGHAADPGDLDIGFDTDGMWASDFLVCCGMTNNVAYAVAIQDDGKILLAGEAGGQHISLLRLNSEGDLDQDFNIAGYPGVGPGMAQSPPNEWLLKVATDIVLQEINDEIKIVIVASYYAGQFNHDFAILRYNLDGTIDTNFDTDGLVTTDITGDNKDDYANAVALDGDNKIVVAGSATDQSGQTYFAVARYNENGTFEKNHVDIDPAGNDRAYALSLDANGDILLAGEAHDGSSYYPAIARINKSDLSLAVKTVTDLQVQGQDGDARWTDLKLQGDKILVVGYATVDYNDGVGPHDEVFLGRFNDTGAIIELDTTFGTNGIAKLETNTPGFSNVAYALDIDLAGRIFVAGSTRDINVADSQRFLVGRFNAQGNQDASFGNGGWTSTLIPASLPLEIISEARGLAIQSDQRLVVAGSTSKGIDFYEFAVARYFGNSADLSISIDVDRTPPDYEVGDTVNYTMTLTNNGLDSATGVHISITEIYETIDTSSITFDCSVPPTCEGDLTGIIIQSGSSETVTFAVTVANALGDVETAVSVSANELDPDLNNNGDTVNYIVGHTQQQGPVCGDGMCDNPEDCTNCDQDCGVCPPGCGDGTCDNPEDCTSCSADCGVCPPECGDGTCDNPENCTSCSADCGACPPECGDGTCETTETCSNCGQDCGACPVVCGDDVCDSRESCSSCSADCGACLVPADRVVPPVSQFEPERLDIEGGGGFGCSLIQ